MNHAPPPTDRRRVVVTGMGVISPVGLTVAEFWDALLHGRSGIGPITAFDASNLPVRIAGEVRGFDPTRYLPRTAIRWLDPSAHYAVAAATEAIEAAKLEVDPARSERTGVLVGTAYGPMQAVEHAMLKFVDSGPSRVSPFLAAVAADNSSHEIARRLGAHGPSSSVTTACATGATSIGEAVRMIQHGYVDVMVAGGTEHPLTDLDVAASANARALSRRNDDPTAASRPFDRDRDGFVLSAGAGVVVLEAAEHALQRGAPILAELAGYAATTDTYHLTAPHPEGKAAALTMSLALTDAGLAPAQVDYINAHSTGTDAGDRAEVRAIRAVFGDRAGHTPVSSVKSMIGHMIGASGAVELIATIQALRTDTLPPTINCDHPEDPELDFVAHRARQQPVQVALSNSFGFGGHNAVLVLRQWPRDEQEDRA